MSDERDPNEQQIRDALRGVAESGGQPDEAAAWNRIATGIAADGSARRRRVLLGGAGLAIAGAAAAFVVVAATSGDEEAVEVGPAAESTTTSIESTTTESTAPVVVVEPTTTSVPADDDLAGLPEHPVVVVVAVGEEGSRLDLYDGDSGELVVQNLAEVGDFGSLYDVSIEGGTIYYTDEFGDSSQILSVPWDGSSTPVVPFGLPTNEEEATSGGTMSPDGSMFAFIEEGVTRPRGRIGIVEVATGSIRYLEWAADEDDFFLTEGSLRGLRFSPDGSRLAFVSTYEGEEVRVVDLAATTLSDSVAVTAGSHPDWLDDGRLLVVRSCCFPDFDEPAELRVVEIGGDGQGTDLGFGEAVSLAVDGSFVVAVQEDGTVIALDYGDESSRTIQVDGRALDVGL